jgi:protein kinase A
VTSPMPASLLTPHNSSEVDWERLYKKEIPAPYVPRVDGEGDASCFESYAEIDVSEYGQLGPDPHGHLFALF